MATTTYHLSSLASTWPLPFTFRVGLATKMGEFRFPTFTKTTKISVLLANLCKTMVTNPCSFKTELLGSMAMACTSHVGMTSQLAVFEQIRPRRTTFRLTHQLQSPSYCISSGIPPMRVPERVSHRGTSVLSASKGMVQEDSEKQVQQEVAGGGNSFRFMAEGNMWLLEFQASGLRVLADPWLVDDQTFWDQPWLYTGRSQSRLKGGLPGDLTMESVNSVDAILICQDYEDHCHPPTLKLLRKDIPVIASPKAARIVQGLGFSDVRSLGHGEWTQMAGLQVWATVGARVGPPWSPRENGFVLQDLQTGLRFYYEPHCSFDEESVRSVSPVDVVITPGRQYKVAGFPLTESVEEAVRLLRILKPQLVIPIQLTHLETTGVAAPLLQLIGSENDFEADLRKAGITARLAVPPLSGHFMHVQLGSEKQAF